MKISTKGRYALRMLLDLAEQREQGFVALKEIAERQNISKKYLEQIVPILNRAKVLKTNRGYQGGYQLAKAPDHGGDDPPPDRGEPRAGGLRGAGPGGLSSQRGLSHPAGVEGAEQGHQRLPGQHHPPGYSGSAAGAVCQRLCDLTSEGRRGKTRRPFANCIAVSQSSAI